MASKQDIKAGGAFIELYVKDASKAQATLKGIGATYQRFSATVSSCAKIAQRTITACNQAIARSAALTNRAVKAAGSVGRSVSAAGRAAMFGGGARVAAMGISASNYMGFEREMSKVRALTQATGDEYSKLVALAKELGVTTEYTAQNAAEGMSFLGLTGYKTNQILAATPVLLDLATAGAMDLGRAADIASDTGTAFGISADNIARVADVMAAVNMNANTNIEMMGETFKYVASMAKLAEQPIEETAAAIGLIANSGIKASMAGTGLRSMLMVLGSKLGRKKLFREFGVNAIDAKGNIKPLLDTIQDLDVAMKGMSSGDKIAKLSTVFTTRSANVVGALVNQVENVGKMRGVTNDAEGATKRMAATMRDNLFGSWKELVSAVEAVQIAIGEAIAGELRGYLDSLTKIVREGANWISQNKELVATAGKVAAAVAGIGVGVVAVGTLLGGVGAIVAPLISAIAGFGIVGVGVFGVMASLVGSVVGILGTLVGGTVTAGVALGGVLLSLGPIGAAVAAIGYDLVSGLGKIGAFGRGFKNVTGAVSGLFKGLSKSVWEAVGDIGQAFSRIFGSAVSLVSDLRKTFVGIWDALKAGDLSLVLDITWTEIELRFEQGKQFMLGVFYEFSTIAQKLISGVKDAFLGMFDAIKDELYKFLSSLNQSKNNTLLLNLFPDLNLDSMREGYLDRLKKKQISDSQKRELLINDGVLSSLVNVNEKEGGTGALDKLLRSSGFDPSRSATVYIKQQALLKDFTQKHINYIRRKEGESGLDDMLRSAGRDPKQFERNQKNQSPLIELVPKTKSRVDELVALRNKKIEELQARRESLLQQAQKEAAPSAKIARPAPDQHGSFSLVETILTPNQAKEEERRKKYESRMQARDEVSSRNEYANAFLGLFTEDQEKAFSDETKNLWQKAYGREEPAFSEKAKKINMPPNLLDVLGMRSGGGTFSAFEMGNLGGNTLDKKLDDQVLLLRKSSDSLKNIEQHVEDGGSFG